MLGYRRKHLYITKGKTKKFLYRPVTGSEGFRRYRLSYFQTVGT